MSTISSPTVKLLVAKKDFKIKRAKTTSIKYLLFWAKECEKNGIILCPTLNAKNIR